jgi:OOP family OmpA-OmpF porin
MPPYVSAGAGLMGYQPTNITTGGLTVELNNGENIHELVVPMSIGSKFMLSKGINLDLGYKMNFVGGDNLDGYRSGPQNDKFSY